MRKGLITGLHSAEPEIVGKHKSHPPHNAYISYLHAVFIVWLSALACSLAVLKCMWGDPLPQHVALLPPTRPASMLCVVVLGRGVFAGGVGCLLSPASHPSKPDPPPAAHTHRARARRVEVWDL